MVDLKDELSELIILTASRTLMGGCDGSSIQLQSSRPNVSRLYHITTQCAFVNPTLAVQWSG